MSQIRKKGNRWKSGEETTESDANCERIVYSVQSVQCAHIYIYYTALHYMMMPGMYDENSNLHRMEIFTFCNIINFVYSIRSAYKHQFPIHLNRLTYICAIYIYFFLLHSSYFYLSILKRFAAYTTLHTASLFVFIKLCISGIFPMLFHFDLVAREFLFFLVPIERIGWKIFGIFFSSLFLFFSCTSL